MGFLEKEQKLRQEQEAVQRATEAEQRATEAEQVRLAALQKQKDDEDRTHASEDNVKISELLANLPKFNIREYLELVKKHTGYDSAVYLYTRDDGLKLIGQEFNDKLAERGLTFNYNCSPQSTTIHPHTIFCGRDIHPSYWFHRLEEPKEPGIGICFEKHSDARKVKETPWVRYDYRTVTYEQLSSVVCIRLTLPVLTSTTGKGEKTLITSFETFDNAIERGFKYPHGLRVLWNKHYYCDSGD